MHTQAKFALCASIVVSACLALTVVAWPSSARGTTTHTIEAVRSGPSFSLVGLDRALAQRQVDIGIVIAEQQRQEEEQNRQAAVASVPKDVPAPVPASTSSATDAIATYFPDNYASAVRVADCESTLNANAYSAGNYGLFQINRQAHEKQFAEVTGHSWADIFDPYLNAQFAAWLYGQSGWGPWACRWAA